MAPAKLAASSSVAQNAVASLSSPVSLLWAYQLRREHNALLARIDELATAVSDLSPAQLKTVAAQAARAETISSNVKSEQAKLKGELDQASERSRGLGESMSKVYARLDISEESLGALRQDVRIVEEQLKDDLMDELATVQQKLQQDLQEQERQVREMKTQLLDMRNRVPHIVKDGLGATRDTVQEMGPQGNRAAGYEPRPEIHLLDPNALQLSDTVQPNIARTADMLAFPPNSHIQSAPNLAHDVDFNGVILTPEREPDALREGLLEETRATLPQTPRAKVCQYRDSSPLKQGKFQSWSQYIMTGEAVVVELPRRKEGAFVEAFVAGMYHEVQRRKCEMMLDEVGWCWESVKEFDPRLVATAMETSARQRTEVLIHKHEKGKICPVYSPTANFPVPGDKATGIANNRLLGSFEQSPQRPQRTGPRRKSQRIYQQRQGSPSKAEDRLNLKLSTCKRAEPASESQLRTYGMRWPILESQARADPLTVKGKPSATGPGAASLIGVGQKSRAPPEKSQLKSLAAIKQDVLVHQETRTTPEGPRNKKRALEAMHQPLAKVQPVTPLDHTNHYNGAVVPKLDGTPPCDAGEVAAKDNCKKRRLIGGSEFPDSPRRELVTPSRRAIQQSCRKEPQGKATRKKRAVGPIPLIPILPLSDDE